MGCAAVGVRPCGEQPPGVQEWEGEIYKPYSCSISAAGLEFCKPYNCSNSIAGRANVGSPAVGAQLRDVQRRREIYKPYSCSISAAGRANVGVQLWRGAAARCATVGR